MNIHFQNDIIVIDDAIPLDLCDKMVNLVKQIPEECVAIYDYKDLYNAFIDHWYSNIEPVFMKTWLYLKDDGSSTLYLYEKEDLDKIQKFIKTEWRDLFVLNYISDNTTELKKILHCDFSNFTFSCGLVEDTDFEGGELIFPRQDFKIKLKKGQMAIFPGGLTHPHYTTNITMGQRIQFVGQTLAPKQDHVLGEDHDR